MEIKLITNMGDKIYMYDPEDGYEKEKEIADIVITGTGKDNEIYLRADMYDDVICTYDELINTKPDAGGMYYFRCKKSRDLFKESIKGDNVNG